MPRAPKLVAYEGRNYPSQVLCDMLGVSWAVLQRWIAQGGVTPAKVELHQREREERRRARLLARAAGLGPRVVYQRVMRGETLLQASSRPALSRGEVCARMRGAKRGAA